MKIRQGSLTIFMTLILSLLVTLTCAGLLAVRMAASRTQILCGMDIGLYSLFAGYDRDLLKEYDLFFLDGSYGSGTIKEEVICDTFGKYMEPVLYQNYQNLILTGKGLSGYTLATDQGGTLFYKQATEYEKKNLGVSGLRLLMEKIRKQSQDSGQAEELWNHAGESSSMDSYEQEMIRASHESNDADPGNGEGSFDEDGFGDATVGGGYHFTVVNPIPIIQELWRQGLLGLVLPAERERSAKKITGGEMLSGRNRNQGIGSAAEKMDTSLENRALFHEYILRKMADYEKPSGKKLDYETEYILFGKKSDEENLKAVAQRILLIREGLNLGYLLGDSTKNAEAEALAYAIASAFLVPPAGGILKTALLLCWSFAESLLDLRTLFRGGRIPAMKSPETWQLGLGDLAEFTGNMDYYQKSVSEGLNYIDYLRIIMWTGNEGSMCLRCMDCIEEGIRAKGRQNFRFDTCIGEVGIWAEVLANGRKLYYAEREYAY